MNLHLKTVKAKLTNDMLPTFLKFLILRGELITFLVQTKLYSSIFPVLLTVMHIFNYINYNAKIVSRLLLSTLIFNQNIKLL